MPAFLRRALLVLFGIGLAALAGELYLRATDKTPTATWGWKDIQWPNERNELGYRGQSISYGAGDLVVVLLGDSQVQADTCTRDVMPEQRLQHHLGRRTQRTVKVFSLGCLGYGQDQELLALDEYLQRYRADAVVSWFTDGNDTWNNTAIAHSGGWPPKPTFWLDADDNLCGPTGPWGTPVYSRCKLLAKLDSHRNGPIDEWWDRRLPAAYQPLTNFDGVTVTDWKIFATAPTEIAKERTALAPGFVPQSPRGAYANRLTNKLLRRTQELVAQHRARLFALLVDRPDFPLPDGVYAFTAADQSQRYVKINAARHHQSVQDALDGIDTVRVQVKVEPFCTPADPHLNPPAIDQVMDDLAAALVGRLKL